MRRRSVIAALFAVPTLAAVSGCGGDQSQPAATFAAPSASAATGNTLETVKQRGTLIVGVKYDTRPFGYVPEGQAEPVGFDIDLSKEFAKRLGVDTEFVQVSTQNRILNLQSGSVDVVMASMLHTAERAKTIDFSIDYFGDQQFLLVPTGSDITGPQDLAGVTVALAQGGAEEANLKAVAPDAKVLAYQNWPDALQAMLRGEAAAVSSTLGLLYGLQQSATEAGTDVDIVGAAIADGPVGAGFRKDDRDITNAFDDALVAMAADGTYDRIFQEWWGELLKSPFEVVDTRSAS